MDIFKCKKCRNFKYIDNCNYGYCTKLKDSVYEDNTFCEADGKLDPNLWFMKDDMLKHYLGLEKIHKINILPKHLDRKYYIKRLGLDG